MSFVILVLKWLLGIFVALVFTVLLTLYIRGAFRWRSLFHIEQALAPTDPRFPNFIKALSSSLQTQGTVLDFWDDADEIQHARLDAIGRAERTIQFETFMMTPGKRADDFADAIIKKANEGVQVQLLVDSWGTRSLEDDYWKRLRAASVEVVFFNPFDWRAPANYAGRTHRKLLIIDDREALIGGAGISNLWDGTEKSDDTQPWFDIEFLLQGEVIDLLSTVFQMHWRGHKKHQRKDQKSQNQVTCIDTYMIHGSNENTSKEDARKTDATDEKNTEEPSTILIIPGTKPSYRSSPIETTKQTLVASARERIWLSSPYFLPNMSTRNLLIEAQKNGVDVRILTTSTRSDKKPVYYASYEVYGDLLKAGIQIYEYQPSMLHAKMLLIDNEWTNTGSANLDYRSFLHNDELDILTNDQRLFAKIEQTFEKGFSQSEQTTMREWRNRSWLKHRILGNTVRLVQWQL